MYEQKICYIDLYRNGVKCGNMGHVRMEWDEERYRIGASLCRMEKQTLVTAVLERTGGRPRTTIQNIAIIHGRGSAQLDWMPLEGNEERLLFQASGEVYGVCILPKMREAVKQEAEEGVAQNVSTLPEAAPVSAPQMQEAISRISKDQSGMPETIVQMEEKRSRTPETVVQMEEKRSGTPDTIVQMEEKRSGTPEAVAQPEQRHSGMPDTVVQTEEKSSGMLETVLRTMEKQNIAPESASQPEEKRSGTPKAVQSREKQGAVREMGQQGAVRWSMQERARRGAVQDTVVLTYPQDTEERRRRERHVTNLSDDKWKQLCSIYPIVHPIGDDVEFIKITPADFVVLRQEYQNLVRNSFLLHGYYNYEHILLGKYPDKYYIGVPGVMHEQERIAAAMFGFVGFEHAEAPKEQKDNRDRFGYYMMEVGI